MSAHSVRPARLAGAVVLGLIVAAALTVLFAFPPIFGTQTNAVMPQAPVATAVTTAHAEASALQQASIRLTTLNSIESGTFTNEKVTYTIPKHASATIIVMVGKRTLLHVTGVRGNGSYPFQYAAPASITKNTTVTMTATIASRSDDKRVNSKTWDSTTFMVTPARTTP